MDPDRENHPVLYHVMKKIGRISTVDSASPEIDLEQPPSPASAKDGDLVHQMPHLNRPKVLASMASAISDVAYSRSVLQTLGPPPDHESVDAARAAIAGIESRLCKQLEEIVLSQRPDDVGQTEWRAQLAKREEECRRVAEEEMSPYKAVVQLYEMHESYEKLLENAEERLVKIYGSAEETAPDESPADEEAVAFEEVVRILQQPSEGLERVDLDGRQLRFLPEAFGQFRGLVALKLSSNLLEVIPDSIAGLENLQELNLSGNLLVSLPDSIGLLLNLKILDVSGNKITVLPDSICKCRSLVELDASYNKLTYLPTNIGSELVHLQKLFVHLNKIRSLPTSIGEMRSLHHLDAHFNELCCLPQTIGGLIELEILNLSSNFSDLRELPDTFGDLINLKELDLSNNQIHYLPATFGRLDKLTKLNLEHNPLVIPPMEIQTKGVEAVKAYMRKMWVDILVAEEGKSTLSGDGQSETGWLTRSTSWLNNWVVGVSGYLGTGERSPRDPYLDQQL